MVILKKQMSTNETKIQNQIGKVHFCLLAFSVLLFAS